MKNPFLIYTLTRLGVFVAIIVAMVLIGFDAIYSTIIAGVLSLAFSLAFLGKQRDAVSAHVANRIKRSDAGKTDSGEGDLENEILDRRESPSEK